MDLKKRLAQLDKLTRRPESPAVAVGTGQPGEQPDQAEVLAGLGLTRHETSTGPVWSVEHLDSATPPPDPLPALGGLFTRAPDHCPALKQVLFLDTETTGLAGGTGTLVFQLGLSWWQDDAFRTRQYFLPGPGNELAMLTALGELAKNFTAIVTFNGASFDLPLLRTRSLLNRLPDPLAHLVSWDLLVPARRLWGNRLPDCRQQTLEVDICGRERASGDIDGARIPQTWFDFLACGQPGLLNNVLTHNHRDMVGMAEIFSRVCRLGDWLAADPGLDADWPAADLAADRAGAWALGRICERRLQGEVAATFFTRGWQSQWGVVQDDQARGRFWRDAIRNLKRCRSWDLVEEMIHDALISDAGDTAMHREAAILYEHRLVDLERALQHARLAGDEHRTARLERLLARRDST